MSWQCQVWVQTGWDDVKSTHIRHLFRSLDGGMLNLAKTNASWRKYWDLESFNVNVKVTISYHGNLLTSNFFIIICLIFIGRIQATVFAKLPLHHFRYNLTWSLSMWCHTCWTLSRTCCDFKLVQIENMHHKL